MGVFDKTEVSTIPGPINTVTILRVEEMIALPIKFDNVFHVTKYKEICQKVCCMCRVFVLFIKPVAFFIFLFPSSL